MQLLPLSLSALALAVLATGVSAGEIADRVCGRIPCEYTVRKGDSVGSIAKQFNLEIEGLLKLNPLVEEPSLLFMPTPLEPGQVLNLTDCKRETAAEWGKSVVDLLCQRNEQELFLEAIDTVGLTTLLSNSSTRATVFAPTNNALRAVLASLGITQEQLLQDKTLLPEIVSYHIAPGEPISGKNLTDGLELPTLLSKQSLKVSLRNEDATPKLLTSTGQEVKVIKEDYWGGNSVVHVVNEVLLPAASFGNPCTYEIKEGDSLWGIAQKSTGCQTCENELQAIIDANPHLSNINSIAPGDLIYLPC